MPIKVICEGCKRDFFVKPKRIAKGRVRFCSMECRKIVQYTGRFVRSDGYVAIRVERGKYDLEHRVVMAKHIGRIMERSEHIHHRNGIKHDNRIENLEIVGVGEHISKYHAPKKQQDKWIDCKCLNCGKSFQRVKLEVERHPNTFCKRGCYIDGKRKNLCA